MPDEKVVWQQEIYTKSNCPQSSGYILAVALWLKVHISREGSSSTHERCHLDYSYHGNQEYKRENLSADVNYYPLLNLSFPFLWPFPICFKLLRHTTFIYA